MPEIRALYDLPGEVKTHLLRRGDYLNPGMEVRPGVLSVMVTPKPFEWTPPASEARTSKRRLAFAEWLTQPGHPLTARVIVNRLWLHHFGEGLVSTADNFGPPNCFTCRTSRQGSNAWPMPGRVLAAELLHLPDKPAGVERCGPHEARQCRTAELGNPAFALSPGNAINPCNSLLEIRFHAVNASVALLPSPGLRAGRPPAFQ